MHPVVTDVPWSVCVSVGHEDEPYKRGYELRYHLACGGPRNHILVGGHIPHKKGHFWKRQLHTLADSSDKIRILSLPVYLYDLVILCQHLRFVLAIFGTI